MSRKIYVIYLTFVALLCIVFTVCQSSSTFNGSRVANEDYFSMTYSVLNQEETASMELNAGDSVDVEIDQTSGSVDVSISLEDEKPIYEGKNLTQMRFSVNISEAGDYRISVTGNHAAGSISFSKATGNQEASADLIALMEKIRNNVETGTTGAYMTALEAACDILEWADRQSLSIAETNAVIMDWLGGLTPEEWDTFSIQMEHVGNACTDLQTDRAEDLLSSIGKSADDVSWDSEDFDMALAITSCCGGTQ